MRYLQKYVGLYRVIAEYNKATNDYPRITEGCNKGQLDPSFDDIFISCNAGGKIYHCGGNKLVGYIPSLGRGHNIIKAMYSDIIGDVSPIGNNYEMIYKHLKDNGIIFDIEETDSEVLFKFKANNIETIAKYMKPKTNGASKGIFAKSNLPHKKYDIPYEDLALYKDITALISKDDIRVYVDMNNGFMSKLATKKYTTDDIKADMNLKGIKGKEYFHSIGVWSKYIEFAKNYINNKYSEVK